MRNKPVCVSAPVCAHESVHVWGSTKPDSEKEKREMPSEPKAWEARRHIILEEMHRQQRGTRCNTLMNKYAEGWNWSLVLSGGGKKTKQKQGWIEALQFDEWYRSIERSLRDAFYCQWCYFASFCLCRLITAFSCSIYVPFSQKVLHNRFCFIIWIVNGFFPLCISKSILLDLSSHILCRCNSQKSQTRAPSLEYIGVHQICFVSRCTQN